MAELSKEDATDIAVALLRDDGLYQRLSDTDREYLTTLISIRLQQAWHQGAIAAIDAIAERMKANK